MSLREMAERVRDVNVQNGWFYVDRTFGDEIALLHSEVSEMLEEFRDHGTDRYVRVLDESSGNFDNVVLGREQEYPEGAKPLGVPSEAADILIRLLDTCWRHNIDLEAEFEAKLRYNATRGHRHGGKRL